MFLGEPPRTQADLNFSLLGIPVRVHPLFWLFTIILGFNMRDPAMVATWVAVVFVCVLIHELGHALTMRAFGFYPWITLYGLGGLASCDQGRNWNPRGSSPLGQCLIALAGPAAGFLLAGALLAGIALAGHWNDVLFVYPLGIRPAIILPKEQLRLMDLLNMTFFVSVIWGLINLLPIYPLDGGQVAREVLLKFNPRDGVRQSLWLSVFAATGMAVFGFLQWGSFYVVLLFGYLAFSNYTILQSLGGRGRW